jgi:hypothetical protein
VAQEYEGTHNLIGEGEANQMGSVSGISGKNAEMVKEGTILLQPFPWIGTAYLGLVFV